MATILDAGIATGLEQVRSEVADFSSADESVIGRFTGKEVAKPSRWGYRWAYYKYMGGSFEKVDLNGGILASGTGPLQSYVTAGFYNIDLAFNITQEQINMSKDSAVNLRSVMEDILANVVKTSRKHFNSHVLGDGYGYLTQASSASADTSHLTFNGATDFLRTNRLFDGMRVDVWNSGLSTKRGTTTIANVNQSTQIVTFGSAVSGTTSGDRLVVVGADRYGPSTLVAGTTSTWGTLGNGLSSGPGFTGDTWLHGLEYVNKQTGYFLGRQLSAFPELMPVAQDAASTAIDWGFAELIKNKLIMQRDPSILTGLNAVMHMCQHHQLQNQISQVQHVDRMPGSDSPGFTDLKPSNVEYSQMFNFGGIPAFQSKMARFNRVDLFNSANWGTIGSTAGLADYMRDPDGAVRFFEDRNTDAQQLSSWTFHVLYTVDFVCHDPGAGGYIHSLSVPAGYLAS